MVGRDIAREGVVLVALVLAGCATAHAASAPEAPGVLALSAGRLGALGGGLRGLASAITGGRRLRSVPRGDAALGRRRLALGGLVAGVRRRRHGWRRRRRPDRRAGRADRGVAQRPVAGPRAAHGSSERGRRGRQPGAERPLRCLTSTRAAAAPRWGRGWGEDGARVGRGWG